MFVSKKHEKNSQNRSLIRSFQTQMFIIAPIWTPSDWINSGYEAFGLGKPPAEPLNLAGFGNQVRRAANIDASEIAASTDGPPKSDDSEAQKHAASESQFAIAPIVEETLISEEYLEDIPFISSVDELTESEADERLDDRSIEFSSSDETEEILETASESDSIEGIGEN